MLFWKDLNGLAQTQPETVALVYGHKHISYRQYRDVAVKIASAMEADGLQPGDRVAIYMDNCLEQAFCYFACLRLGVIAVPLNPRYREAEAAYAIEHSGARVLIVSDEHYRYAKPTIQAGELIDNYYVMGRAHWGRHSFRSWWHGASGEVTTPEPDPDAPAFIMYTSGSTARPKGVTHSQRTLYNLNGHYIKFTASDHNAVNILYLRAAHAGALYQQVLFSVMVGGKAVILTERRPVKFLQAFEKNAATHFIIMPADLIDILEHPHARHIDWSTLKVCIAGGDQVPLATHQKFREITGHEIQEICGMTENGLWTINPLGEGNRIGSIGLPVEGFELKIIDDEGNELGDEQVGEMIIRTDGTMLGYWNNPEATAETIRDGWLHSGDLGRRDADGYYWFEGRKKQIIVRGGSNIAPQEVENAIDEHPAVEYACAVGVPDERLGERVMAYVALHAQERGKHSEGELIHFVEERLADYKVPERLVFVDELPINATGKLNRIKLKADAAHFDLDAHELIEA